MAATKDGWRYSSKLEWIEEILLKLPEQIDEAKVHSVNIPALGCGAGGLDFNVVGPLMEEALSDVASEVNINIFA